jgi:hypothetical protein
MGRDVALYGENAKNGDKCNNTSFESQIYRSLIYAWAPGNEGMALPNNVGFVSQCLTMSISKPLICYDSLYKFRSYYWFER